ncbi:PH and SEC7 domain-containing protein 1-like isoform X1 [Arapaima gigas]
MEEEQACLHESACLESGAQVHQGMWVYVDEPAEVESQFPLEDDDEEEEMGAVRPASGEEDLLGGSLSISTKLCFEPETPDSLESSGKGSPDLEWIDNPLSVAQNLRTGEAGPEMSSLDQKSDSSQEQDPLNSDREEIQEEESPTPTLQEEVKAEDEAFQLVSERHEVALRWTANGNAQEATAPPEGSRSENLPFVSNGTQFEFRALDLPVEAVALWNGPYPSGCTVDVEAAVEESGGVSAAEAEVLYECRDCSTGEGAMEKLEEREGETSPRGIDEKEDNGEQAEEERGIKISDNSAESREQRDQQMLPSETGEEKIMELSEATNHPGQTDCSEQPEQVDLKKPAKFPEPEGQSEHITKQTDDTEHKELFYEEPSEDIALYKPHNEIPQLTAGTEATKESILTETIQQTDVKDPSEAPQQLELRQPEELKQICSPEPAEDSPSGPKDEPENAAPVKQMLQTEDTQQTKHEEDLKESNTPQANGGVVDREEARRLAERLYRLDNVRHTDVVKHMDKDNDFSRAVGEEYLKFFDFAGQSLDQSLRSFLKVVVLIGETQERERVLEHFSHRFHQCNPDSFSSQGAVLTLTCALMLLNTDLHGQNVGKAMNVSSFVSNLDGMNEGKNFCKDMLKNLYNSIKNEHLEWAIDEEELKSSMVLPGEEKADVPPRSKSNPFQDVPHDKRATVFKQGFLTRKTHADIDGKRTPWGKRSWKTFYAVLKGMVLYLQKDEYRMEWQSSEEVVSVHHALAEKAGDYTKKPHVFRLQTADWRVFLFQASTAEQMSSWICRINLVSALYSSPPFPAAVGSQRKFSRPILPAAQSTLSMEKQLQSHCHMLESFSQDLADLLQNPPEGRKAKARELEEYKLREEYLQHETSRYEIYKQMLEKWKGLGGEVGAPVSTALLESFDSELCMESGEEEEDDGAGLKKSHSSPSLNLELAPAPVVKVKRNISERRTYRKIIIPRRNREL